MLAAVAVGGALGSVARYGVSRWAEVEAGSIPWTTLSVNLAGSFALGALLVIATGPRSRLSRLRPFLATGLLGAFTTYSTFAVEADLLIRESRLGLAVVYALLSVVGGLAAAAAGWAGARRLGWARGATS